MKRYRRFMDRVRAPAALRRRLLELEEPDRRPVPWARYGAAAAAFILVCGLGVWAAGRLSGTAVRQFALLSSEEPEADIGPDIAPVEPGESTEPAATRFAGSYEVSRDGVTASYLLPYIEYGEAGNPGRYALDWDVPPDAVKRDLTQEDIAALLGGEDVLADHLAWGAQYVLTGWAAWNGDGSFWGAYLNGVCPNYGGPASEFEFAVTAGQLPPTCIAYPDSMEQNISGVMVTAISYETTASFEEVVPVSIRQVSFMAENYGYRFDMRSGDPDEAEEMVSRLVRRIIEQGVNPLEWDGSYTCSNCGQTVPAGTKHSHPFTGVGEPNWNDGGTDTPCYDPNGAAEPSQAVDPNDNPPVVPVCPECGVEIMPGTSHGHGICGLPLAPEGSENSAAPPVLRAEGTQGGVDGRCGNYQWSQDLGNGETAVTFACGAHPLCSDPAMDSLTTGDAVVLLSCSDLPGQVEAVCWPDSAWGDTAAEGHSAQVRRAGQGYELTLNEGGWLYEIAAQWEGRGDARYVFYIIRE